jgi:riboflavin kinase/FMN adenylyltransferase
MSERVLPQHLRVAIDSPARDTRLIGVGELTQLAASADLDVAAAARDALTRLADDDSRSVAAAAAAALGRHHRVEGVIVRGDQRGREIGFPTANLSTDNELVPPHGVYATAVTIDGELRPSVTNIGQRPTFGDQLATTIETHLLPFDSPRGGNAAAPPAQDKRPPLDLYGRIVHLAFVQRLRDERKFPDVEALQEQIAADVRRATRLFDRLSV